MDVVELAVLDVETTGMSADWDRVVEVFVQRLVVTPAGHLVDFAESYHSLHDPGRRIPREATAVHGITDAMVRGHRIDDARLAEVAGGGDLVIAHNVAFDKGFIRQHVPHCDAWTWGCSCRGIGWKKLYPRAWTTALQDLAQLLRIPKGAAHRARGDVETTCRLLLREDPTGSPHVAELIRKKLGARLRARPAGQATR
ncbi:MAG: hypothetical protein FJ100_20385 [Deltaproteobacteria bacterium]|nr:hypothetical protein [Deltaproteobacteria bacterium]